MAQLKHLTSRQLSQLIESTYTDKMTSARKFSEIAPSEKSFNYEETVRNLNKYYLQGEPKCFEIWRNANYANTVMDFFLKFHLIQ